ncbi:hypothetical protein JKG47_04845 [Acidithiobacillus sp. MC6.1]|nr:hypothetical protein [Acidithiobacillus sp. MC6.1]
MRVSLTTAIREINAELAARYPDLHGPCRVQPRYWLLPQSGIVHVRGWVLNCKWDPMGTTLFSALTFVDALAWIERRER